MSENLSRKVRTASLFLASCFFLSPVSHGAEATYRATFENLWNRSDHPLNYPSNQHFSPLVGASHDAGVNFWLPGILATSGVESVAETGATGTFVNEVNFAVGQGDALQSITGAGSVFLGQTTNSNIFAVDDTYPLVTFLSMIAPSPDWFVGIHSHDLRDGPGFLESQVFEFNAFYDAGTENGNAFSTSNSATNPLEPIFLVDGYEAAQIFSDPLAAPGTQTQPIARLTLTRLSQTVPEPSSLGLAFVALLSNTGPWRSLKRKEQQ